MFINILDSFMRFDFDFFNIFIKAVVVERYLSALWLVKNVNKNVMRQSKPWSRE